MIYLYLVKAMNAGFELTEFEGMAFLQKKDNDDEFIVWRRENAHWRFDYFSEDTPIVENEGYSKTEKHYFAPAYKVGDESYATSELNYVDDICGALDPFEDWLKSL
jgi:hypothetical protein